MNTRNIITVLGIATLFATAAFASEVPRVQLKEKDLTITAARALLVRTAESPKNIHVHMTIPFERTVCVEYGTEIVFGPDPSCGYHTSCHTSCTDRCVVSKDGHCEVTRPVCEEVCHDVMNSCNHPETVCVRHGVETDHETRSFRLVFKNASKLAAGEEEHFLVAASQNGRDGNDDQYELFVEKAKEGTEYKVQNIWFFGDMIQVKGK